MERTDTYWDTFHQNLEDKQTFIVGKELIQKIKTLLEGESHLGRVLEVGCGTGTFTESLCPGASHIVATDISEDMVKAVSRRFEERASLETALGDCTNLAYEGNSFDSLLMANVLHVIEHPEKALEEAARVLKPQGKLIIISFTTWGMEEDRKASLNQRYAQAFGKAPAQRRALSPEDLETMTALRGFKPRKNLVLDKMGRALFFTALLAY